MQLRLQAQRGRHSMPARAVSNTPGDTSFADDMPAPADKGKQGRNCNVTACQRPGAWFYNNGTRAYYCLHCAWDIRKFNNPERDGFTLFTQWEEDLRRYETEMRLNSAAREQYVAQRLQA